MTLEQIKNMTDIERSDFMNITCHTFQKGQSLKDYAEAIRAYIYIWRRIDEERATYTFDSVTERVIAEAPTIKKYYAEKAPVDEAAVDVDYCCG